MSVPNSDQSTDKNPLSSHTGGLSLISWTPIMPQIQTEISEPLVLYTLNAYSMNEPSELIIQERLRQARYSFNVALVMTAASTIFTLVGVGLVFTGNVSVGLLIGLGGITGLIGASSHCVKLAQEANDRLDKIAADLKNEN